MQYVVVGRYVDMYKVVNESTIIFCFQSTVQQQRSYGHLQQDLARHRQRGVLEKDREKSQKPHQEAVQVSNMIKYVKSEDQ